MSPLGHEPVIAGLDPAIHSTLASTGLVNGMNARIKSGDDDPDIGRYISVKPGRVIKAWRRWGQRVRKPPLIL